MERRTARFPVIPKGLSARVLLLTIAFVMLSEGLIFAPSIARFRLVYMQERIVFGHLASLALEAAPLNIISKDLEKTLLQHAEVFGVRLRMADRNYLALSLEEMPKVEATYMVPEARILGSVADAFAVLARPEKRIIRVVGHSPKQPDMLVDVLIDEHAMRREMLAYSGRILLLSLVIAALTASLIYLACHWIMIRPLQRLTRA